MELWNELYNETSISDLSKRGFKLQDIDMLVKGRAVNKYLEAQQKGLDTESKSRTNKLRSEYYGRSLFSRR